VHVNSFPAIHLKKLDWLDFACKFSGEIVVGILGLAVFGLNVLFFWGGAAKTYADNSLASKFLSYHISLNPKLYAKNNSVLLTVSKPSILFTQARADEPESISSQTSENIDEAESVPSAIDEQGLSKPNPDSISAMIAKQIKVYETKSGDSLKSIADQNGVNTQTLMWANNLSNTNIKPGWFLRIPPTDGVIYNAKSNDTIPDLAKRFSVSQEVIISYNGLESAEDIEPGQLFILPGGSIPQPKIAVKPKAPATSSRNRLDGKVKPQGVVRPDEIDNGTGHTFPWGYCTWYVATRVHVPWGGNAKNWLANAKGYGAVISKQATPGAIVVTTDSKRFGHVAYVESVDEGGFVVSEMNYEKFGKVNRRYIPNGSKIIRGFIYP
jgi:peptidoglycan DL-endopeptidase CwlO